ncbi:hypothetical protein BDZ89DRAFT_1045407 [Hymenopellis radicata]|nr:hypothetical protein BDZ89DRAFT_1045407 [Hymenopellis radicata]
MQIIRDGGGERQALQEELQNKGTKSRCITESCHRSEYSTTCPSILGNSNSDSSNDSLDDNSDSPKRKQHAWVKSGIAIGLAESYLEIILKKRKQKKTAKATALTSRCSKLRKVLLDSEENFGTTFDFASATQNMIFGPLSKYPRILFFYEADRRGKKCIAAHSPQSFSLMVLYNMIAFIVCGTLIYLQEIAMGVKTLKFTNDAFANIHTNMVAAITNVQDSVHVDHLNKLRTEWAYSPRLADLRQCLLVRQLIMLLYQRRVKNESYNIIQ